MLSMYTPFANSNFICSLRFLAISNIVLIRFGRKINQREVNTIHCIVTGNSMECWDFAELIKVRQKCAKNAPRMRQHCGYPDTQTTCM